MVVQAEEVTFTPRLYQKPALEATGRDGTTSLVRIRDVADVIETETMDSISRREGNRLVTVTPTPTAT